MSTGMVVCAEPPAAEAGAEILRLGGNAMDAAVAASFAQGVTNPMLCGIGGKGVMTVYQAETGELIDEAACQQHQGHVDADQRTVRICQDGR